MESIESKWAELSKAIRIRWALQWQQICAHRHLYYSINQGNQLADQIKGYQKYTSCRFGCDFKNK